MIGIIDSAFRVLGIFVAFVGIPAMLFFAFLSSAQGGAWKDRRIQMLLAAMSAATMVEIVIAAAWEFDLANDDTTLVAAWYVAMAIVVLPWLPGLLPRFRPRDRE